MGSEKTKATADVNYLPSTEDQFETIEEARRAIANILEQHPALQALVENTEAVSLADITHRIKQCMSCKKGKTHFVGRNRLPKGRLGMGGLSVCDHCGEYDSSNLS